MDTTTNLPTTTIAPEPASPGGLDGWAINCSSCGRIAAYSIESMTRSEAAAHLRWHRRTGRA